ncbi:group III truncated hemoglobin [Spiribacter halobius]|uniref:group III truncated hemoglobin n=1 Tax=Sediminicurvatus halobius TaxID=2182432 RepID=UPI0011B20F4D|nr:group III truncated hemoglobin [Spiribacter halobius]UEX76496.1 group III truncated hemoglobin [Spiribacter halobius]
MSELVRAFYARLLDDPLMAPVFVDVAGVDLSHHLPRIEAFWRRMLFREPGYRRHMIAHHERVQDLQPLTRAHFQRWQAHFLFTLDERFHGPEAERAARLARRIAAHMAHWLLEERPRRLAAAGAEAVGPSLDAAPGPDSSRIRARSRESVSYPGWPVRSR